MSHAILALTDGVTINWNVSQGPVAQVTLGGNRTLANPTSATAGQRITIEVIQDATGNRTLSFGAAFVFPSGSSHVKLGTEFKDGN